MKLAFYDTKPYDKEWFEKQKPEGIKIIYLETKLNETTAALSAGCEAVCAFVNDVIDKKTVDILYQNGVRIIAMRCAGYNNIDMKHAYEKIHVVRVPAYSPYAVAEHAIALLLCLNRKIHKAYNRIRESNFTLAGLTGFDLHGKTVGVIGTGMIGKKFIQICKGFGMHVLAYDPYPDSTLDITYTTKEELFQQSDIISLHCPLTEQTYHIIDDESLEMMKPGVILLNTSRGPLIKKEALLLGLKDKEIGAAGLDVYEEEAEYFFEDFSNEIIEDEILAQLMMMPNVIITSHQAFLTREALENIADTTYRNLLEYMEDKALTNEICYCKDSGKRHDICKKKQTGRCF